MLENIDVEEQGYILHQRLLDGDVTASAEIAELFMPSVTNKLRQRYPKLDDPHLVETAVEDAILSYFRRPERYDPAKLDLDAYLLMSANGDLLNLLRRYKKEMGHLRLAEIVELEDSDAEHGVEVEDDFDLETWVAARTSPIWQSLHDLLPDPIDQEIVILMMEGVRETEAYADVLDISNRPADEQAAIVKRHKDRLKKKLQRAMARLELDENGQ